MEGPKGRRRSQCGTVAKSGRGWITHADYRAHTLLAVFWIVHRTLTPGFGIVTFIGFGFPLLYLYILVLGWLNVFTKQVYSVNSHLFKVAPLFHRYTDFQSFIT